MTQDAPQPTTGSLSARIIRACNEHQTCALDCPRRTVEELGEIASFSNEQPTVRHRLSTWLEHILPGKGT